MAGQRCEVIGCPLPAEWQQCLEHGSRVEQYLCCHHWSSLRICAPSKAMFYIPVSLEAGSRTAIAGGPKPEEQSLSALSEVIGAIRAA